MCSELADAEKRAQAANASVMVAPNPGHVYAGSYGNPQMGYVGVGPSYIDPYNMHQMVQPNVDAQFQYGPEAVAYFPWRTTESSA
ncbi:hypothetical protein MKX01_036573 [Papaver californicum]|nr:hypothetical protein MKX01_036573 [Papaver californicum]